MVSLMTSVYFYYYYHLTLTSTDKFLMAMAVVDFIILFVSIFYQFINREHILETLCVMTQIDKLFSKLNFHFSYIYINIVNLFIACVIIGNMTQNVARTNTNFLATFSYVLMYYGTFALQEGPCLLYFVFIAVLSYRINVLIGIISKWNLSKMEYIEFRRQVTVVSQLYLKMCRISVHLDCAYSINLLASILHTSLILLIWVVVIITKERDRTAEISFWVFISCFTLYANLFLCSYCSYKVSTYVYLVKKLIGLLGFTLIMLTCSKYRAL